MSKKTFSWFLVLGVALAASLGSVARADIDNASATNVQEGDNETESEQSGRAGSGDAVGGSVVGVVSSGDASVDATNRSEDVEIETGDANGANSHSSFTGLTAGSETFVTSDITDPTAVNVQEGDNETEVSQEADVSSGDGVGGQVIGVVTTQGGSTDIVAANTSEDVEIETGEANADNDAAVFVGLNAHGTLDITADIINASATNVQEGDNEYNGSQSAAAGSGDAVGGQVIGAVSAGHDPIDATNHSEDVELETGEALAENSSSAFVGLTAGSETNIASDIVNPAAVNVQEGDNEKSVTQDANASSGDAVGGQVAGVVSSTGGSVELVLANTSIDIEGETGDSDFNNWDSSFTGLNATGTLDIF